ncbi:MliC family protein [Proteus mirabilis]|uniref:MliC family protein n=1 Tax=Proteus mirabilis TaxID=584 RepID=UPI001ADBAD9C|nr:MliC family protein [Proteus mirabilis]MBO8262699.1 MliC family protein [Proteus mirabilis]MBO8266125.1 MliC family protein [Proteus mirabilis]MBO8270318.1 MliC family protein [Proteus mirabilis]MBO8274194.1 MliC family protein [Proteus mirabilis]MBO8277943.1 MliC family protein [Proteus mirabilis]
MRKLLSISAIALLTSIIATPALAAKTEAYDCEGQKIRVSFPNDDLAVMDYNDELIVLKSAVAASGARYVGESFQLWGKGSEEFNLATMSEDEIVNDRIAEDTGRTCKIVK